MMPSGAIHRRKPPRSSAPTDRAAEPLRHDFGVEPSRSEERGDRYGEDDHSGDRQEQERCGGQEHLSRESTRPQEPCFENSHAVAVLHSRRKNCRVLMLGTQLSLLRCILRDGRELLIPSSVSFVTLSILP